MVQKFGLKQNKLLSDQGMMDNSGQTWYASRYKDLELQLQTENKQMRVLRLVGGCEINFPCHLQ